ncbi:hypothetical protein LVJ59_17580 [Microbacterium sp. KKR3/1]|uniref:hypothetical protein n=1 Tax=Microbacterium sp. KKR3/1 TaxID=2904241 RepID=UPI001E4C7CA5|nr:hypothetical protein [Microbacterium sp. KKR3/1]MCE0510862.1 hypothetical protein [Microbacterium sp. KKR3/1]
MTAATEAWARANGSPARSAYVQGYEQGALEERERVTSFLADNIATITEFAGARTTDLLAYMFREMKPAEQGEEVNR